MAFEGVKNAPKNWSDPRKSPINVTSDSYNKGEGRRVYLCQDGSSRILHKEVARRGNQKTQLLREGTKETTQTTGTRIKPRVFSVYLQRNNPEFPSRD